MTYRRFTPTPVELAECVAEPFNAADYFDTDEIAADPEAVARSKARHEKREAARVAQATAHVERIRRDGVEVTSGHARGWAYNMGQSARR